MKIKEVLQKEKRKLIESNIEDATLIAKRLLAFILKIDRNELIFHLEKEMEQEKQIQYEEVMGKIIQGVPLQYITNTQEFMKYPFYVDENVLIPQPDTEILVEEVLKIAQNENKEKILDICTGSGCIGISLACNLFNSKVTMSDISKEALEIAKKNVEKNQVKQKVTLLQSNLFENIKGKFDIIVSNPPYIETKEISRLSKQVQAEPIIALDGGEDGLYFYRKLIQQAPNYLEKEGYLCMEIGYNQRKTVTKLLEESKKYKKIETKKDLAQNDRVLIAVKR